MSIAGTLARTAAGAALLGASGIGYAAGIERRRWTLRRVELPVLDEGARPLRILHLSDFHLMPGQRSKMRWIAALDELDPHLVIDTGDNLAHPDAVPGVLTALGRLLERPGAFVFGSNDYYGPTRKNPARYLRRGDTRRVHGADLPWTDLRAAFREHGWVDATHARHLLEVDGRTVRIAGVDDPHLNLDRYPRIAGHDADADLRIGLTHSPSRGCSTALPPTATTSSSPATPTAASCGCPATAHSSPTAGSTGPVPAERAAGAAGCGCTCRPGWAPRRTRRCASRARRRPRC